MTAVGATTTASVSGTGAGGAGQEWTGWSPLPSLPEHCDVWAADLSKTPLPPSWLPISWVSSGDGTKGCREVDVKWGPTDRPYLSGSAGGVVQGGRVVALHRSLEGVLEGWNDLVYAWVDGPVIAAIRSRVSYSVPDACEARGPAMALDLGVFGVHEAAPQPSGFEYQVAVALDGSTPVTFSALEPGTMPDEGFVRAPGPLFMGLSVLSRRAMVTVPYDGSAATVFADDTAEGELRFSQPVVVATDIFFSVASDSDRTREHVYHAETGITEVLIDVENADVLALRADGTSLVWIQRSPPQSVSADPETLELWSSPHATTPAELSAVKLADLAPPLLSIDTARLESGMFAFRRIATGAGGLTSHRYVVYRLSDARYWTLDAADGWRWEAPLYLAPDEISIRVSHEFSGMTVVRRQLLSELGEPQPVTGVIE